MKRISSPALLAALLASLAWLGAVGFARDADAAAQAAKPAAGAAKGRVKVQDEPLFIPEIPGNQQFQMQLNDMRAMAAGRAAEITARMNAAKPLMPVQPVILLPGFACIPLPNPLAKWDTRPGFLGVTLENDPEAPADEEPAKKDAPKKIRGVGIGDVIEDSPAAKAGLKEGDRVLKLEGKEATSMVQLREMIRALKPEQEVKLMVRRDEKEMEIKAKLGASPDAVAGVQGLQLRIGGILGLNGGGDEPQAVPGVVVFAKGQSGTARRFSSSSATQNAEKDNDSVTLRDGNRFIGKIRGIDPAKGLILRRDGEPELELIEEHITALTFAERAKPDDAPKAANAAPLPKVVLQLGDGSSLHGDALTMEKGVLRITLAAGDGLKGGQKIEIPRVHAQSLMLSDGDSPQIYEGPTAMAGWTSGRYSTSRWDYRDGRLRTDGSGPIGRDLGRLPDPIDMSFDVDFPRQMQHIGVQLFTTGVNESGVGTLSLNFSPDQIHGNHYDGKRTNQYSKALEQKGPRVFSSKPEKIHYRLLVDRVNGRLMIYVNGTKLADWKLSKVMHEDLGKCGGTFSIMPHASMSEASFQLSNVRILPWDGKEPAKDEAPVAAKGDQVLTSKAVSKTGTIEKITDGGIFLAAQEGKIPREKTIFLRFAEPEKPGESAPPAATARLRNGSEISAAKVTGTGEALTITTRSGPQITLPFSAMRSLEFLPRAGQPAAEPGSLDLLTLNDGTQLAGRAVLPITEPKVGWQIAASKAPLEFESAKVAGVLFRSSQGARKSTPLRGDSAIRLGNGDWLPGDIVSIDGRQLVMKTDIAQEFSVPLQGLRAVYLGADAAATVADGATGPELWSEGWNPSRTNTARQNSDEPGRSERPWKYFDGSYTVMGIPRNNQQTIARKWPAYSGAHALNFDSFTPGRSAYFSAQIFNLKGDRTFSLSASGTRMYLYYNPSFARVNRGAIAAPRQIEFTNKNDSGKARVSLVFDRPAKTFRIIVGGKEAGKIAFKEDEAKEALDACGVTLATSYYSSSNAGRRRLDHLWFAPWNGTAEKKPAEAAKTADKSPQKETAPSPDAEAKPESPPVIYLTNGDDFTGAIEKITPDLVTVNSEAGPLEIPSKRVAWIHFPNCAETIADHYPHLRFHDRGLLSVNDLRIGDDRVQCRTLAGQPLEFPLSVVKEIVWRPLAEK